MGDPHNEAYLFGSILESPYFGKLPGIVDTLQHYNNSRAPRKPVVTRDYRILLGYELGFPT